jgi:hypothetical protein
MFSTQQTFTLIISVKIWMGSDNGTEKIVLLNFLEDIASGMDFEGQATATAMTTSNNLWFTFDNQHDFFLFRDEVSALWNDGAWLAHD